MAIKRAARAKGDHDGHIDFLGFAPDADLDIPGACSVMDGLMPTSRGWRAMPPLDRSENRFFHGTASYAFPLAQAWVSSSALMFAHETAQTDLLTAAAASLGKIHRVYPYITGVQTVIDTGTAGAIAVVASKDVTGTSTPSGYVRGPQAVWCDFGGVIVAGGIGLSLYSTTGQTLTPIAASPSSTTALVQASRFLVNFDLSYGWRCCARDNALSWTLSPATLAAQGSLPGDNSYINRAAAALGDDILLFKGNGVYRGAFVPGDAEVWKWRNLNLDVLALRGRCAAPYKQGVVVLAEDGLYYYDGASLINFMNKRMSLWFVRRVLALGGRNTIVVDEVRNLIWISVNMYDSDDVATYSKKTIVCDPESQRFAFWNGESIHDIFSGPHMYPSAWSGGKGDVRSGLRTVWGLPTTAPYIPREIAGVGTAAAAAIIVTNDFGDAFIDSELTRVGIKFTKSPTGTLPIATGMVRNNLDEALSTLAPVTRSPDGHFDVRQNSRWHRIKFDLRGDFELAGYAPDMTLEGLR